MSAILKTFSRFHWPLFALLIASLVGLGGLLFDSGALGYRHDWNIPFFPAAVQGMWNGTDGFTIWNQQQFGAPPFYPTLAPFQALVSALSFLGLSTGYIERTLIFAALALAGLGFYNLLRYIGINKAAATLGAIGYLGSSFMFTEISKGILQDPLSYAALPWVSFLFFRGARTKRFVWFWAAGVLWGITSFQVQYLVYNAIILGALTFELKALKGYVLSILALLLTDAYFLAPMLPQLVHLDAAVSEVSTAGFVHLWSPSVFSVIRLTGCNCTFPEQAVSARGVTMLWIFGGSLFALFSTAGLLLNLRRARAYSLVFGLGLLLACGTSLLGPTYLWLIAHLPGGFALRESFKATALVAFGECAGFAMVVDYVSNRKQLQRAVVFALSAAVVAVATLPFISDGLETQVQRVIVPSNAGAAFAFLAAQKGPGRMMYLPMLVPMLPKGARFPGIDPTISWPARPSFGNYLSTSYAKSIASCVYQDLPVECGGLLAGGGVRFIEQRHWLSEEYASYTDAINVPAAATALSAPSLPPGLRDLNPKLIRRFGTTEDVYEFTKYDTDRAVHLSDSAISTGDLSAIGVLRMLSPLVFYSSQIPSSSAPRELYRKVRRLIVVNGEKDQIPISLIDRQWVASPGRYVSQIDANAGWANLADWNTWWWYRDEYQQSLTDVALAAPGAMRATIDIPLAKPPGKRAELILYVARGMHNGKLGIRLNHHVLSPIKTRLDNGRSRFQWVDLGTFTVPARPVLRIENLEGENAVGAVAFVPLGALSAARNLSAQFLADHDLAYVFNEVRSSENITIDRDGIYLLKTVKKRRHESTSDAPSLLIDGRAVAVADGSKIHLKRRQNVVFRGWQKTFESVILSSFPPSGESPPLANVLRSAPYRYSFDEQVSTAIELDNNYSPHWRGSGNAIHAIGNGFANVFVFADVTPGRRQIYYDLQLIAELGAACSLAAVVVLMLLTRHKRDPGAAKG